MVRDRLYHDFRRKGKHDKEWRNYRDQVNQAFGFTAHEWATVYNYFYANKRYGQNYNGIVEVGLKDLNENVFKVHLSRLFRAALLVFTLFYFVKLFS